MGWESLQTTVYGGNEVAEHFPKHLSKTTNEQTNRTLQNKAKNLKDPPTHLKPQVDVMTEVHTYHTKSLQNAGLGTALLKFLVCIPLSNFLKWLH